MKLLGKMHLGVGAMCLLMTGACTGAGGPGPASAPVAVAPQEAPQSDPSANKAERIAEALSVAEKAERAGDGATLARAALQLEQLGASPQTDVDMAAMERWRASLSSGVAPMRGRALGPAYRSAILDAGAATQLHQTFLGGRSAQIVLRVSRGPVPQLVVRDQSGKPVCAVHDDPIKCRWVPLYTQRHRIEIVNAGPELSEFFIVFD